MKRGDLVMYKGNIEVMAIVTDMRNRGDRFEVNLLQVSGKEWFTIPIGFGTMYRSRDFIVCEKDRKAQMAGLLSRQIG